MLTYDELKENRRKFVAFTSLTPEEFKLLLPAFEQAYLKKYPRSKTKAGLTRKRKTDVGRQGSLAGGMEQKRLFAWVYQKSYPLQSVMGELFGMGNPKPMSGFMRCCRSSNKIWMILAIHPNAIHGNSRTKRSIRRMRGFPSLMGRNDVANGQKRLKNRLYTTVARRKFIVTRT
jgi:hypothetical protein